MQLGVQMEPVQVIKRPIAIQVLFVIATLLIMSTLIVSVLSYSVIGRVQTDNGNLQSSLDGLNSTYTRLQSNCTVLQQNLDAIQSQLANLTTGYVNLTQQYESLQSRYTALQSDYFNLTQPNTSPAYSLQVIHQNITWLANSSQSETLRLSVPIETVINVSGFSTMTVLMDVTDMSNFSYEYDVGISLATVSWSTSWFAAGSEEFGSGGFMQESGGNHFQVTVKKYPPPPPPAVAPNNWQVMFDQFSTIETKAPYAFLVLWTDSTATDNGWAMIDLYLYLRN
jgi:hypothetical protein